MATKLYGRKGCSSIQTLVVPGGMKPGDILGWDNGFIWIPANDSGVGQTIIYNNTVGF